MIFLVILMFEHVSNLEILSVWQGISTRSSTYKDRFSHCFVYKISGRSRYEMPGQILTLEEGNILYIPKGCSYSVKSESAEETGYIAINFYADMPDTPGQLLRFSRAFNPLSFSKRSCVSGFLTTRPNGINAMPCFIPCWRSVLPARIIIPFSRRISSKRACPTWNSIFSTNISISLR